VRRWPAILLIVSLVANVFLAGMIGGGLWRWTHVRDLCTHSRWRVGAAESLPEPQATAFRQAMKSTLWASRPILRDAHAARAEASRLFVQPRYDGLAITAALDKARADDMIVRTALEHRLVVFSATLPQDQRQKLADALKAGPFRERRRDGPH